MSERTEGIDPSVPPSGTGCVECLAENSWWFHLRRCAQCGHVGCCDQSLGKHATAHFHATGHPIIASFEPGKHGSTATRPRISCKGRISRRPARIRTINPRRVRADACLRIGSRN